MQTPIRPPGSRRHERGAALLTAMIIVTLISTLAAAMVWQQWRAVQVEAAERARAQSAWILSGALDFARLILREDMKTNHPTALTDPWATPLAESRLSTFLAADKGNPDDGPEAFLSGNITDAQARYNLNNLLLGGTAPPPAELETLERLCQALNLDASVATLIASRLRAANASGANGSAPLQPRTVDQLAWLGIDATTLQTLRPYVVVLPVSGNPTAVNINTAPKEVLMALIKGLDAGTAERVVQARQRKPFADSGAALAAVIGNLTPLTTPTVQSNFFEIRGRLRLVDHVLTERSLVQRNPQNRQIKVLSRERIASLEQVGS